MKNSGLMKNGARNPRTTRLKPNAMSLLAKLVRKMNVVFAMCRFFVKKTTRNILMIVTIQPKVAGATYAMIKGFHSNSISLPNKLD